MWTSQEEVVASACRLAGIIADENRGTTPSPDVADGLSFTAEDNAVAEVVVKTAH